MTGPTAVERALPLPGDELVRDARVVIDQATTLAAPPERVWPWVAQLGKGRGGWYLPRAVEAVLPRRGRALRRVDPQFTALQVGDEVPDWGPGDAAFRVALLDPPHALVYRSTRARPRGRPPMELSWALVLHEQRPAHTRLHLRLRIDRLGFRAPGLVAVFGHAMDSATVRPMFAGLAERL